jgi:hypothetical protein
MLDTVDLRRGERLWESGALARLSGDLGEGLEGSRPRVEGYGMKERNRPELLAFLDTDKVYAEHIIVVCRYGRNRLCSRTYDINILLEYWGSDECTVPHICSSSSPIYCLMHQRLSRSTKSAFLSLHTSSNILPTEGNLWQKRIIRKRSLPTL